ncbi:hypothetical protein LZ198_27780 [Myxococcus sp. K15C18031901]|uniref:hypothetical protein n=1 Tax=Myxococcus dinghuensis TaxID=2906761 RepID=UPI0020A76569|nr:hypothetical protein [Myxococcus dinghuensis]MCP3102681.1 hypothetical protein [Myxococcus dinghuensis]
MLNKLIVSAVVVLSGVAGISVAAEQGAPSVSESVEVVCLAPTASVELTPPAPISACPSYCAPDRVACLYDCGSNAACREICVDAYITCCGF